MEHVILQQSIECDTEDIPAAILAQMAASSGAGVSQRQRSRSQLPSSRAEAALGARLPRQPSLLAELGRDFLLGEISAPRLVRYAAAAAREGAANCSVHDLASLEGQSGGDLVRRIWRVLEGAAGRPPEPYYAQLPICSVDPATGVAATRQLEWPLHLPLFSLQRAVQEAGGMTAVRCSGVRGENLRLWCQAVAAEGLPRWQPQDVVAVGLYGDAAQHTKRGSVFCVTWNVLGAQTPRRYPITAFAKSHLCSCGCRGFHTLQAVMEVVAWSCSCLAAGVSPSLRHDGQPLGAALQASLAARPTPAAVLELRGDWQFFKLALNLRSWASRHVCWQCDAARGAALSYFDFAETAAWRRTELSHADFVRRAAQEPAGLVSAVFSLPGFQLQYVAVDVLHTADLGVSALALGSLFAELLREVQWGRHKEQRLQRLNAELKAWYQENPQPSQLQQLSESAIREAGKPPQLKAKGAECRYLVPFAAVLARQVFAESPSFSAEHYASRAACLSALQRFYESLQAEPWEPGVAAAAGTAFLQHYGQLHDNVRGLRARQGAREVRRDAEAWAIKPKHHLFAHLVQRAGVQLGSPKLYWTYADEDFMGLVAGMAAAAPDARTVAQNVLRRMHLFAALFPV